MDNATRVLKYFRKEIYDLAESEEANILADVEKTIQDTLSDYEVSAKSEAEYILKHNKIEISSEGSKSIAGLNAEKNKQLNDKREAISSKVFEEVKNKLEEYVNSKEYKQTMLDKIDSIVTKFDIKEGNIYLKENDSLGKDIKNSLKVIYSKDINIGGFIIENKDTNIIINESYDALLEDQKEWFYLNSGLFIK